MSEGIGEGATFFLFGGGRGTFGEDRLTPSLGFGPGLAGWWWLLAEAEPRGFNYLFIPILRILVFIA